MDNIEKTKPAVGESNYDARSDRSLLYSSHKHCGALAYLLFFQECATPPHIQVHHCIFIRPSPALVLQVTNTGVRRPGYEPTCIRR